MSSDSGHFAPHTRRHHSHDAMMHARTLASMSPIDRLTHEFGGIWDALPKDGYVGRISANDYGFALKEFLEIKRSGLGKDYNITIQTNGNTTFTITGDINALMHDVHASIIRVRMMHHTATVQEVLHHKLATKEGHAQLKKDWVQDTANASGITVLSPAAESARTGHQPGRSPQSRI